MKERFYKLWCPPCGWWRSDCGHTVCDCVVTRVDDAVTFRVVCEGWGRSHGPETCQACLIIPSLSTYLSYRHATFLPDCQGSYLRLRGLPGTHRSPLTILGFPPNHRSACCGQRQVSQGAVVSLTGTRVQSAGVGISQPWGQCSVHRWTTENPSCYGATTCYLILGGVASADNGTGGSQAAASRREMFMDLQGHIGLIGTHTFFCFIFFAGHESFLWATDVPVFYCRLSWVGPLACMCPRLLAMDSLDSPLVQHLLTSWRPAWRLNRFDGRTSVHTFWGWVGLGGLESGMFIDWTSLFLIFIQRIF